MPGIKEYDISSRQHYTGSRLKRYSRLEFNSYGLRSLLKKMRIDVLKQMLEIRKLISQHIKPDVVHLHTLLYPAYLGVFSKARPLVVTIWNGDITWKQDWSLFRKFAVKKGLATADLITVDSDELREKTLWYGDYSGKTAFISFGVDTKRFHPGAKPSDIRQKLNIEADAPLALSNRSLEDIYNIDVIIKAIPTVLAAFPKTIFLFAWHSASRKAFLMELTERLGVMDNVRFIGRIKHEELPPYYAEADIFISVPGGDTIPISLLEAMACGAAPIVSDLPSLRECITDGVNGCIVPLRDAEATAQAVIKLLTDHRLREAFVKRNCEWVVQHMDWDANMRKVEELYYRL